mmetsp:Transcript_19274/g.13927  ORF Transcript_19274/g.13927 Transcript_19274/m.13927 type:complete len:94 (+) Transcript_19274:1070-1351(+)
MLTAFLGQMRSDFRLEKDDIEQHDPTVEMWLIYFLAQHNLFIRNFPQALAYTEEAIAHTPTNLELYILKAQIYKHMGDLASASSFYEEARKLD